MVLVEAEAVAAEEGVVVIVEVGVPAAEVEQAVAAVVMEAAEEGPPAAVGIRAVHTILITTRTISLGKLFRNFHLAPQPISR